MTETRWLSDDEQRAWRQLAAIVLKLPTALERQLQRDAELTHFEYWVLAIVSEAPERSMQLRDLAEQANSSQSRLSHVIRRLEERGLLKRVPCPGDGRASNAVLTETGWDKVVAAAPGHVEHVRSLVFDGLDAKDVDELGRLCARIVERLDGDRANCVPEGAAGPSDGVDC